jgi:hypothetical protein
MAFTELLPIANRSGVLTSGARNVPEDRTQVEFRFDLDAPGTPNEFTDPDAAIEVAIQWSPDGGTTWSDPTLDRFIGEPSRVWGKTAFPLYGQGIPQNPYPTHARAGLRIRRRNASPPPVWVTAGTVRFGVSVQIT